MLENVGNFLKTIRNIHTKCIILKMLYFRSITENKVELKYSADGYLIVQK